MRDSIKVRRRLLIVAGLLSMTVAIEAQPQAGSVDAVVKANPDAAPSVVVTLSRDCHERASCRLLSTASHHPAILRRASDVRYRVQESEDPQTTIAVHDPSGELIASWKGDQDPESLRRIWNMIENAREYLVAAGRSALEGDVEKALQQRALASFMLGNLEAGEARLQQMLQGSPESRQIASIWSMRLGLREGTTPDEAFLLDLIERAETDYVRFESWMLLGEQRARDERNEAAIDAFRQAMKTAGTDDERKVAWRSLSELTGSSGSVGGLGASGSLIAGQRIVHSRWTGSDIESVTYRLDGRDVARAETVPYVASIDFGPLPERHVLEVSALDPRGSQVRSEQLIINGSSHDPSIRMTVSAEQPGTDLFEVSLVVRIPEDRTGTVLLELDGRVIQKFDAPPYITRIGADRSGPAVLRAILRLEDGSETEDVRLLNVETLSMRSDVHRVEVPVYSDSQIRADELVVLENGRSRPVKRLIAAGESPLIVSLLIDASSSVAGNVLDLEEAALSFVDSLNPEDQVMVVSFNTNARITLWPTSDRMKIRHAIWSLRAGGLTAVNDAIISSLLHMQPTGSRRAILVITDGHDTASLFSFHEIATVGERYATPIYAAIMNPQIPAGPRKHRMPRSSPVVAAQNQLSRIARRSGGAALQLWSPSDLSSLSRKISDDLAKQHLLVYEPATTGPSLRSLEVSLNTGKRLRAPEVVTFSREGAEE